MLKRFGVVLIVLILILGGLLFRIHRQRSESIAKASQIRIGMTRKEVEQLLGHDGVTHVLGRSLLVDAWEYEYKLQRGHVRVCIAERDFVVANVNGVAAEFIEEEGLLQVLRERLKASLP